MEDTRLTEAASGSDPSDDRQSLSEDLPSESPQAEEASPVALQPIIERETQRRLALLSDALMLCCVHLSSDTIENEFEQRIDQAAIPVLASLGLSAPCSFDLFCERWGDQCIPDESRKSFLRLFNRSALLAAQDEGETRIEAEFRAKLFNDATAILRCTAVLEEAPDGSDMQAMILVRDVTLQREAEQRQRELLRKTNETLRAALEAAGRASALRADFLAKLNHSLRATTAASPAVHPAEADRMTDYLQKVTIQSRHLLDLLNEVSDMNSLDNGRFALQNEPMSLRDLYTEILDRWLPQINAKHQQAEFHICALTHEQVIGDQHWIAQVLDHLLRNAVHFTPDGGTISLTLSECPTEIEGEARFIFIVRDTGLGISPEQLRTLFDPYLVPEEEAESDTAGFGLPIYRSIVQRMNGDITVVSESEKGSTFNVSLTLQVLDHPQAEIDPRLSGRSILVIDDDELNADAAQTMLTRLGTAPEVVNSGKAAIALMLAYADRGKGNLFAVLMNADVPDCPETMQRIRSLFGDTLPVLLTALQKPEALPPTLTEAATQILRQPLFAGALSEALTAIADSEGAALPQQEETGSETFEGKRVLLVEDNDLNAEIAQELLGSLGLECETVTNGREAVDRIAACTDQDFDIILMDIIMPLMNGYEATQAIRMLDLPWAATIPITAMSTSQHPEDIAKALASGCNEYLAKPLDECKLRAMLHRLLA